MKTDQVKKLEREVKRLRNAVEELSLLNDIAVTASHTIDISQMIDIIVKKACKAVKAELGTIMLITEGEERPLKTYIRRADLSGHIPKYRVSPDITGWVLKHQEPLIIKDLARDKRFPLSAVENKEVRSVLCVPIWYQAKIIGILMMTNKRGRDPFSTDDLRLLSIIAVQAGQLIQNSRLQQQALEKDRLEHELELAAQIQKSILPHEDPELEALSISSFFKPARGVGGDYYDFFELGEELGIVIADVSGHGSSAAMMMSMVKGIIHLLIRQNHEPARLVSGLNDLLMDILPDEVFITMTFVLFDSAKRSLSICNAGHHPPLLKAKKGAKWTWLEMPGCALNLIPRARFMTQKIDLGAGGRLILYTDGIVEAMNERGEFYGKDRLLKCISANEDKVAQEIGQCLTCDLNTFSQDREQSDDIAFLILKT